VVTPHLGYDNFFPHSFELIIHQRWYK